MDDKLHNKLSSVAYGVTQNKGTEPPDSYQYNEFDKSCNYLCICCDNHLFRSAHKFNSSCGWPAFSEALDSPTIKRKDSNHNMIRTEILCKNDLSHLGHKFNDDPTGTRYCINSVALQLKE